MLDIDVIKPLKSIITFSLQLNCLPKNIFFVPSSRSAQNQNLCIDPENDKKKSGLMLHFDVIKHQRPIVTFSLQLNCLTQNIFLYRIRCQFGNHVIGNQSALTLKIIKQLSFIIEFQVIKHQRPEVTFSLQLKCLTEPSSFPDQPHFRMHIVKRTKFSDHLISLKSKKQ